MIKKALSTLAILLLVVAAYLLFWPVPIDPVAWNAPQNMGYSGKFAPNDRMANIKRINMGAFTGPEDVAIGPDGLLYIATHEGSIVKVDPESGNVSEFVKTGGRPLGIEFDKSGTLYIADAYRGLLEVSKNGKVTLLTDKTESGSLIQYADDVDIASDGSIYFTDATTRFDAKQNGGTLNTSFLDLMEHRTSGRVLKYDPMTGKTTTVLDGLSFANGIAITSSGKHFLVVETGTYSIKKIALDGSSKPETIVDNLPGFPDNINRNPDGTFWVGLVSPRSDAADALANKPFLRRVVMRLPKFLHPSTKRYGFVVRINEAGDILETLQDPSGKYALTTGLIEGVDGRQYITSLTEPDIAVLKP